MRRREAGMFITAVRVNDVGLDEKDDRYLRECTASLLRRGVSAQRGSGGVNRCRIVDLSVLLVLFKLDA